MTPADPDPLVQSAVQQASKIAFPVMTVGFVLMVAYVISSSLANGGQLGSVWLGILWSAIISAICLGIWLGCAAAVGRNR
jgi:hypothetical protein